MIISRSPLRVSIGGGGTDLRSYYATHGGAVLALAIDKYVYVAINKKFTPGFTLKYSSIEEASRVELIKHPIIRESLKKVSLSMDYLEITTIADIPAGTGLGSSGSFTTALLKNLYEFNDIKTTREIIAESACEIEIDVLHEPIGKQDQYIAAYGGLTLFHFNQDDSVFAESIVISDTTINSINNNLLLFFTGYNRSASNILSHQNLQSKAGDPSMLSNLHQVKKISERATEIFKNGNIEEYGHLMNEHWELKKKRSPGMSSPLIDQWYSAALNNGAVGGKIVGAGGGGFFLFYAHNPESLRICMKGFGLDEVPFSIDRTGTCILNA